MYLVAIAWMYVVLMMGVAEALSSNGTVLGALVTVVLYGLLPLSVLLYIMGTPMRRRARFQQEQAQRSLPDGPNEPAAEPALVANPPASAAPAERAAGLTAAAPSTPPDGSGMAAGDAVAAIRKEP